jgi:hypothetical protein
LNADEGMLHDHYVNASSKDAQSRYDTVTGPNTMWQGTIIAMIIAELGCWQRDDDDCIVGIIKRCSDVISDEKRAQSDS